MIYLIAVAMGFIIAINGGVEKRAQTFVGMGYVNPTARRLSSLGGLSAFLCLMPAAFLVGLAPDNAFWNGFIFVLAALAGAFVSGFFKSVTLNYLLSALALPLNIGLLILVYAITRL